MSSSSSSSSVSHLSSYLSPGLCLLVEDLEGEERIFTLYRIHSFTPDSCLLIDADPDSLHKDPTPFVWTKLFIPQTPNDLLISSTGLFALFNLDGRFTTAYYGGKITSKSQFPSQTYQFTFHDESTLTLPSIVNIEGTDLRVPTIIRPMKISPNVIREAMRGQKIIQNDKAKEREREKGSSSPPHQTNISSSRIPSPSFSSSSSSSPSDVPMSDISVPSLSSSPPSPMISSANQNSNVITFKRRKILPPIPNETNSSSSLPSSASSSSSSSSSSSLSLSLSVPNKKSEVSKPIKSFNIPLPNFFSPSPPQLLTAEIISSLPSPSSSSSSSSLPVVPPTPFHYVSGYGDVHRYDDMRPFLEGKVVSAPYIVLDS